jgi:peptidoglycan-N-acetylglucosamine deacetylase
MKNNSRVLVFLLLVAAIAGACRKQEANKSQANNSPLAAKEAPAGGEAQRGDKFLFRGNIANLSIEMSLVRDGERVTGTYFYPRVGKNIALTGTVSSTGDVELTEADETGKQTGVFKGKWQPEKDGPDSSLAEIEGKWSKPDGSKSTDFVVTQQPINFTSAVRVFPKTIRDSSKEKRYSIDAAYPEIQGDSRFDGFNREARSLVTKDVGAFKAAETSEEYREGDLPAETLNSTLDVRYEVRYATDSLISIEFTEASYERGAAHGNTLTTVLNYDVKNNRKLALSDLFSAKSYLSVIANYCMKDLRERAKSDSDSMIDEDMMKTGASPRTDNYRAVAITKKGLWVTFDPYQVAAYAAGPQYVLVPYSALKDIIKPDSAIAALAG